MKKRFIEWDLPLAEISEESALEKNNRFGHPSTLHIWWARKPLAVSRATAFTSLIDVFDDNTENKKIISLIEKIIPFDESKNKKSRWINLAKENIKNQWQSIPKILDPFAGGGSIPLEALRLGCDVYCNDLNPVATIIQKATLEWPQKYNIAIQNNFMNKNTYFGNKNIKLFSFMVEKWANIILKQTKEEIGCYYTSNYKDEIVVGYYFNRTIPCQNPSCKIKIPLTSNYWLSKKKGGNVAYKPLVNNGKINFTIVENDEIDFNPDDGTISRGDAHCPVCNQITKVSDIRRLAQNGQMDEQMIVVISYKKGSMGKKYRIAVESDIIKMKEANSTLQQKIDNWPYLDSPLPNEQLPKIGTLGFRVQRYGFTEWKDLFNTRQKLALVTIVKNIKDNYQNILDDYKKIDTSQYGIDPEEITRATVGYLGIMLDRLADFNSNLCILNVTGGRGVVHTMGRTALPITWDYIESNIFNPEGASWEKAIERTLMTLDYLSFDISDNQKIFITNSSATSLPYTNDFFDVIITDPPYYDSVPYAVLSDFFYVWLKRSIGEYFPDIFSTPLTPKREEVIAEPARHAEPISFFENKLSDAFKEIVRLLKPEGVAIVVYAHKTTTGWETMLNSLIRAGLIVTASWPIHTEKKGRQREISSAVLSSSIYMVCRKIKRKKVGFFSEIQPQIKNRIEEKLQQFWNGGIVGGDFFISAIGPGMEIFSKYERVEKISGEQVTTSELLDYIRTVSTDFIVNKLLKDSPSAKIDNESEFYLAYRWTFLDNTVDYDDARKLASASGVSLEKLWGSGGFIKKSGSKITVLGPKEREKIEKTNSMVDVVHKSLLLWEKGDKDKLTQLLAETGYGKDPAFKQFCQAIAESLLNGNKEKQLLEGFLIGIDNYKRADVKVSKAQTDLKQYGVR